MMSTEREEISNIEFSMSNFQLLFTLTLRIGYSILDIFLHVDKIIIDLKALCAYVFPFTIHISHFTSYGNRAFKVKKKGL